MDQDCRKIARDQQFWRRSLYLKGQIVSRLGSPDPDQPDRPAIIERAMKVKSHQAQSQKLYIF